MAEPSRGRIERDPEFKDLLALSCSDHNDAEIQKRMNAKRARGSKGGAAAAKRDHRKRAPKRFGRMK